MRLWEHLQRCDGDTQVLIRRNDGRIIFEDKIKNIPQVWHGYVISDIVRLEDEIIITLPL